MHYPKMGRSTEPENGLVFVEVWGLLLGLGFVVCFFFRVDENVLELDRSDGYTTQ